jgi:hypothetical protein
VANVALDDVREEMQLAVPEILTPVANVPEFEEIPVTTDAVVFALAVFAKVAAPVVMAVTAFVVPDADTDVIAVPRINVVPDTLATLEEELVMPVTQDLVAETLAETSALPVV